MMCARCRMKIQLMLARSVELDIAVDLGGYTANCRTGIFAMSAAPIQISYIGYLGTMVANYYDYLIADRTLIPEEKQHHYSEKVVYLPCYQVNDSTQSLPATIFTRQDVGLPEVQGSYSVVLIIPLKSPPLLLIVGLEYLNKLMVAYY